MNNAKDFLLKPFVKVQNAVRSEKGQTLVEYALLILLIAIFVYAMVQNLGKTTCNVYSNINSRLVSSSTGSSTGSTSTGSSTGSTSTGSSTGSTSTGSSSGWGG